MHLERPREGSWREADGDAFREVGLVEEFDISVPEEDLENVATVGNAVDLVMAKVAAKA